MNDVKLAPSHEAAEASPPLAASHEENIAPLEIAEESPPLVPSHVSVQEEEEAVPNMAVSHIEINGQGIENEYKIDIAPPAYNNDSQKKSNGIFEALRSAFTGGDALRAYDDGFFDEEKDITKNADVYVKTSVENALGAAQDVDTTPWIGEALKRAKEGNLGPFKAYVDSLPTSALLSKEEKDEAAYFAFTQHAIAKAWDEASVLELTGDVFQSMIVPDNNVRFKELANYLEIPTGGMDYWDTPALQAKIANHINSLPIDARAKVYSSVIEHWEQLGFVENKMELFAFLSRLSSMGGSERGLMELENYLDKLDQATLPLIPAAIVAKPAQAFKTIFKAGGVLKQIARLKDAELLSDAAKLAMQGGMKEAGVSPLSGGATIIPFPQLQKLLIDAPEGMAYEVLKIDRQLQEMIKESKSLGMPITASDKMAAVDRAIAKVEASPEVTGVKVGEMTDHGFNLKLTTTSGDKEMEVSFKLNDVGGWTIDQETHKMGSWIWSPNYRLSGIKDDIVQLPHISLLRGSRMRSGFDKAIKIALRETSDRKAVDNLLLLGDEQGKVFSYTEACVTGIDGVKFKPNDYGSYLGIRQVLDAGHSLMDKAIRDKMLINNIKRVDLPNGQGVYAKTYDDSKAAMAAYNKGTRHSHNYMFEGGEATRKIELDDMKELYEKGYKLVHVDSDDLIKVGNRNVEWAVVKADTIAPITGPVLNKLPGYLPRIREGATWFLKRKVEKPIGDKKVVSWVTERYSNNRTDLETFLSKLKDKDQYEIFADRQLSGSGVEADQIRVMGGLYTGHRKSSPIPFGLGSEEGKRVSPLRSIQNYINSVATSMPIGIFREGLKQKWINSARETGVLKSYTGTESFPELFAKIDKTNMKSTFFEESHKEISVISGIKTDSEQNIDRILQTLGRKTEKIPFGKQLAPIFYQNKIRDVQNAIKTATYHSMLGLGNIAQVFIQGSGALVALATNPIHGAKGIEHALSFSILDQIGKNANVAQLGNKVDVNAWKLWHQSGMKESLITGNLDYHSIFSDSVYDGNLLKKALSNSDIFVRMGEMAYSRIAFGTAYEYVKKQIGRVPTEAHLEDIIARADQYRLNMSKANTSKFQRGLVSIPTQFLQVQTKFMEKIIGEDFTWAEKSRLLSAQVALFGGLGLPLVGTLHPLLFDSLGINSENLSSDTLSLMKRGLMGYLLIDQTQMNMDFGGRIALSNDIGERLMKAAFTPHSMPELISGPSGAIFSRSFDVAERIINMNSLYLNAENVTLKEMQAAGTVIGDALLSIPSSTRNAFKGIIMYETQMYKDKDGFNIFQYRDPSVRASIAQAIGFTNTEVQDYYELTGKTSLFSNREAQNNMAKMMASTMAEWIRTGAEEQTAYAAGYNALRSAISGKVGEEEIMKQVVHYLNDRSTPWGKVFSDALDVYQNECKQGMEEMMKRSVIRTNVTLAKEMEEAGIGKEKK